MLLLLLVLVMLGKVKVVEKFLLLSQVFLVQPLVHLVVGGGSSGGGRGVWIDALLHRRFAAKPVADTAKERHTGSTLSSALCVGRHSQPRVQLAPAHRRNEALVSLRRNFA